MRIAPASVYRNLLYLVGGLFIFYFVYNIIGYDDPRSHEHSPRRQKHLFLTVSKDRIADRFNHLAPKRILQWTSIFGNYLGAETFRECRGLEDRCILVTNRSLAGSADAVFFHGADVKATDLPDQTTRNSSQLYVWASMETPANTLLHTKRMGPEHADFFNWTMTVLLNSDVVWKYGSFWIESTVAEQRGFKMTSFHIDPAKLKKTKSGIFGLISNCGFNQESKDRIKFLDTLSKYMNVTIGGKCANSPENRNICPPGKRCEELYEKYPFYIALENSICKDYVTEKYWDRIQFASIPIVWKRSIMEATNAPPKSFIAIDDYKSIKEMANYLVKLEQDPKEYAEYFTWRFKQQWTLAPWNTKGYRNGLCRLCERLWDGPHEPKSYSDIFGWYEKESSCDNGDFIKSYLQ